MRTLLLSLFLLPFYVNSQEVFDTSVVRAKATFLFPSDIDTLTEVELLKVDSLYYLFNTYAAAHFEIEAHTDNVGSNAYNEALSSRRKGTLINRLTALGVLEEKIIASHFGERKPTSTNADEVGKSQNRRAEIRLIIKKKMVQLSGRVVDEETKEGIPSEIELGSKDITTYTKTTPDGSFSIPAPFQEVVGLDFFAKNYFFKTKMLKVTLETIKSGDEIPLPKIEIGKAYIMEKLFFKGNKSVLLPGSKKELPRILKLMERNSNTCIEIAGNINLPNRDSTTRDDIHFQLSVARSLEIFDYLVSNGIDENRLLAKGYGNWRMIFPKANNSAEMSKNRRVEIEIMHCSETRQNPNDSIPNQEYFKTATNLLKRI